MNDTYGRLKELGMEIISVVDIDSKGRIVIPKKLRDQSQGKYFLCKFKNLIVLRPV